MRIAFPAFEYFRGEFLIEILLSFRYLVSLRMIFPYHLKLLSGHIIRFVKSEFHLEIKIISMCLMVEPSGNGELDRSPDIIRFLMIFIFLRITEIDDVFILSFLVS